MAHCKFEMAHYSLKWPLDVVKSGSIVSLTNKSSQSLFWVKLKKINIVYHFPQYESLRIVLCHYDLCWFLVVYGFDKLTWTWGGKTMLFRGRSWKSPLEHQRRCHRLKNNMNRKDHDLSSSTGSPIALGYATTNFFSS